MAAHKEIDFVDPMLKIINKYPEGCSTDTIIEQISNEIDLTSEDLEESPSRKGEPKYKQIIRNLICHKNKNFFNNVDTFKKDNKNYFKLNDEGKKMFENTIVNNAAEEIDFAENTQAFIEVNDNQDIYDKKLFKMVSDPKFVRIYKDRALAESVKKIHGYQCLYTKLTNGPCMTFTDSNGDNYIEAHHLIPINAWRDFFPKSLDRPSNLAPIAPYYHDILHHGSNEEKKKILKVLYDELIFGLNCDNIYIDFETLFNKYYYEKEN